MEALVNMTENPDFFTPFSEILQHRILKTVQTFTHWPIHVLKPVP
jgi:hypothetical protein